MTRVVLDDLALRRDRVAVVDGASIDVSPGELVAVAGPPRSGKTTLARLIAGLDRPDRGEIYFDGRVMNDIPPAQRHVGYLSQADGLWPHLSVAQQAEYPLKLRGYARRERRRRVAQALGDARIDASADRLPDELGPLARRRAALARILVVEPEVLILDEPLSPLEPDDRDEFRQELRRIHAERGVTTFWMIREAREGFPLADRLAVMDLGRVVQDGPPGDLYAMPLTPFVASSLGEVNLLPGRIEAAEARGGVIFRSALGRFVAQIHPRSTTSSTTPDLAAVAAIRPECFCLGLPVPPNSNRFAATVLGREFLGPTSRIDLLGPGDWRFHALVLTIHAPDLTAGLSVTVSVNARDVLILPGDPEARS